MTDLHLSNLPNLPQRETIVEVASNLWAEASVVALWVGGSLASGAGDRFSDIDFRQTVSQLGRRLAQRYDFAYPSALEATALQGWQAFLAGQKRERHNT